MKKYPREQYIIDKLIIKADLPSIMKAPWNEVAIKYYIAGGACTSAFSGAQINDLDVYFWNSCDYSSAVGNVRSVLGHTTNGEKRITSVFETECAYSFKSNGVRVQYIKKIFGDVSSVLKQFDFSICECAYIPETKEFVMNDEFFMYDLCAKRLRYNIEAKYPIASFWRVMKYTKRGFEFPAIESIKLALCINNLNILTYRDLKTQLEGVDTLFLKDLTDVLLDNADKEFKMTEALEFMNAVLADKLEGGV